MSKKSILLQSRSIPSRPKSRRSSTLDSNRPKHFFYLFAFLLLYFLLSLQFPTTLTHLFLYFYYHFPSHTQLVIILTIEGIPVYQQKAKRFWLYCCMDNLYITNRLVCIQTYTFSMLSCVLISHF